METVEYFKTKRRMLKTDNDGTCTHPVSLLDVRMRHAHQTHYSSLTKRGVLVSGTERDDK